MMISYGAVNFEIEHVYRWDTRAVKSENSMDWLYEHVVIGVQAVLNPRATTSLAVKAALGLPPGAITYRDLRTYMMTSRRQLRIRLGNQIILESPARKFDTGEFFPCDVKGTGPEPISFNITSVVGVAKTLICTFEIETYINDFLHRVKSPAILSHQWDQVHEIDELFYTTKITNGRVVFRKDFLEAHPDNPAVRYPQMYADDFRGRFGHPVPDNFKRASIRTNQDSTGAILNYTLVDREQPLNLGADNPIKKIEGTWRFGHSFPSLFEFSKQYVSVSIKVWGSRTTTRKQLANAIVRALASYGFTKVLDDPIRYVNFDIVFDLMAKFAEGSATLALSGAADKIWTAFSLNVADIANRYLLNPFEDLADIATLGKTSNPPPPGSVAMAGTYIGRMVVQALQQPGVVPPPGVEQVGIDLPLRGDGGY